MGLYYLLGLCLAFFSFPALSAIRDAPLKIGDTTYYQVEGGVKLKGGQLAEYNRNTMKLLPIEREVYQRQTSKIVVDAHKVSAPVEVSSKWGASKVQNAFKSGVKTALTRGNYAFLIASLGSDVLQNLLDQTDFSFNDDKTSIGKISYSVNYTPCSTGTICWKYGNIETSSSLSVCQYYYANQRGYDVLGFDFYPDGSLACHYQPKGSTQPYWDGHRSPFSLVQKGYEYSEYTPLSSDDLNIFDNLDYSFLKPTDKNIPFLSNYLGTPDEIKFSDISEFNGESKTFTYTDENGDTITKQVNTWHNFAVSPSTVTSSSGDPKLEVTTKTQTDTYKDGQKTSSKTETETTKPSDNEDKPVAGGGGVGKETPTDCAFFPTLCKWLDWTQEDVGAEPDLAKIINDEDFERNYTVSFGDNSCPQPISIDIAFLDKTIELSYQPACDLMGYARPFVLISAYIFAIYIGLGVVRNG